MTTPVCWRPTTGAESVPLPAGYTDPGYDHDSPEARVAWARYWREREEAAARETADEAIARCRAEADHFELGAARFELVLDTLVSALDHHFADLAGPDPDLWRGLSLEESSIFGSGHVDGLARAYAAMDKAWGDLNREAYRKAAAEFASILADLAIGMAPIPSNRKGGAAA